MRDQINVGSSSTGIDGWKSRSTTGMYEADWKQKYIIRLKQLARPR